MRTLPGRFFPCLRLSTFPLRLIISTRSSSFSQSYLPYRVQGIISQDGWWRLEHEEVLAPAPAQEPGAGVARGEESGTYPSCVFLPSQSY